MKNGVKVSVAFVSFFVFVGTSGPARQVRQIPGSGKERIQIQLTAPRGGWTVDRMVEVAGTVNDLTVNPIPVTVNGDRYLLKTASGNFKRKLPVTSGKNFVIVEAAHQGGTVRVERTIFARVPSAGIFAVLTSDTERVRVGLHVYELRADGSSFHVFRGQASSSAGGRFYFNEKGGEFDSPGFGPYVYVNPSPPLGIFKFEASYRQDDGSVHTLAVLNLSLFGGTSHEIKRKIQCPLVAPGEKSTLAWVRIEKDQRGFIYSPLMDSKPEPGKVWPQFVLDPDFDQKDIAEPSEGD